MLNQIRASSGIPPRVTLSETRYKPLELCARSHTVGVGPLQSPERFRWNPVAVERAMASLIRKLQRSPSQNEADAFFREAYPFPVVMMAAAVLFIGDVAVVLGAVATMG
jgi:hypothetical protein